MQERPCNLKSCFLCRNTIPEWKDIIASRKKTLFFRKGKKIFSEGDAIKGIFFLYEGSAKVHMQWGEVKELIVNFSVAGEVLGFRGVMGDHLYPISATAMEDVKVCFIPSEFLETTLKTNPSFTYKLMQAPMITASIEINTSLRLFSVAPLTGTGWSVSWSSDMEIGILLFSCALFILVKVYVIIRYGKQRGPPKRPGHLF